MPTTTNITTTYAGEFSGKYVSSALLTGNTIANGLIEVKPNVKYKEVMKILSLDGITRDATCDFEDTSTLDLTERILEPKELQVNLELCKTPFQKDWEAVSMGYSANDNLPNNFVDYFIGHIASKIAEKTEQNIWSGVEGDGEFDGFATLLSKDADLPAENIVAGTEVDATNVVAEMGKVVDAIPNALYNQEDMYIYVSQNVWRAYKRSLGGFQSMGTGSNGYMAQGHNQDIDIQYFDGIKVVCANGLANDTMIASPKSNLFFGCGLLNDQNEVKIIDMADILGDKNVRFIMRYTACVNYAISSSIVTYGITPA